MKKIITFIILSSLLTGVQVQAQSQYQYQSQFESQRSHFAILGGVSMQTFNGKDINMDRLNNDLTMGYHVGINGMFPLAENIYLNPGLLYSVKGTSDELLGVTSTYRINYLELPINLAFRTSVGRGFILLGFGPYASYEIGGKVTYEGGPTRIERDIKFQKTIDVDGDGIDVNLRPFDAGANIFFGYEFAGGLFFQLNSQLGLLNVNPDNKSVSVKGAEYRNTGFGISLGIRF